MDKRIEEKQKERIKALQTMEYGRARLRISLCISESDRRMTKSRLPDDVYCPVLTDEELNELSRTLRCSIARNTFDELYTRFSTLSSMKQHIERAEERLARVAETLAFYCQSWELTEQMETAVNVALLQIPDKEKRVATAMGIAKHLQLHTYCQSVDDNGLLIISSVNKNEEYDAAIRYKAAAMNYTNAVGDFKAVIEATLYVMKKWGLWLDMAATRAYIRKIESRAAKNNTAWGKYLDVPSMYSHSTSEQKQTPKELEESGQPLLYEPYRLLQKFSDIPANEETKNLILKYYICYEETEPDKK